ncbi:MAG: sterol 3beta-glucosyltransferase [Mycobacterium sp.]|nr:sterol 3beta-glucosyltransferase [Mycobacterium sp.]
MSTVLIVAIGSRGDVAPLTGIGVCLKAAGHEVAIAAYTPFADIITQCGLGFRELPAVPDPATAGDANPMKGLAAFASPAGMRAMGEAVLAAVGDEPADIVLLSPFSEMAGHPLAEAKGIPSIGVRLQPLSRTKDYPPTVLGAWSAGAMGNQLAADAGAWLMDRTYGGVVAGFRRDLGLPKTSTRALRRRRTEAHWPVLHGYSPTVAPRPRDWRAGLEVTGYWWPADGPDWAPPAALTDFLAAGPAPVFVGFGSMMTTAGRAEELSTVIQAAARQAGVRAVVQTGWAGLDAVDDDVLTIGDVPHSWLFPQVAAVAHHCGAGTTAAGLRAGVPTIALPAFGDGPFWASRLQPLGVSAATIPQRRLDVERLAEAMRSAASDPGLRVRTQQLARRIDGEDGAAQVLSVVESLLHQSA